MSVRKRLNLITALRVMQDAGFAPVKIVPK